MPALEILIFVAVVFLLAGWVKGVVGLGLPTVAMGLLGLVMAPVQAAALLLVPSLVTNLWQFVSGPDAWGLLRRFTLMLLLSAVGTALGIGLLTAGASRWPPMALGAVLMLYALLALCLPGMRVPARHERVLAPLVGLTTGALSGATGVFVVPAVPYLSALGLRKDELIQALGLSFTVSTLALAVALGLSGSLTGGTLLVSLLALGPALLGMQLGQRARARIDAVAFRRWFFLSMLLLGGYMLLRAAVS